MVCIYCSSPTQVVNSRHMKRLNLVWRRRKCNSCHSIFTTEEIARYEAALRVESPSADLVPFSRDILLVSIYRSLGHRQHAIQDASALVDTIISKLISTSTSAIITVDTIRRTTLDTLQNFDSLAGNHYAAYHR